MIKIMFFSGIIFTSVFSLLNIFKTRLYNEQLHSLFRLPNIVRVIKVRILRLADHVARMEDGRRAFKILTSKPTGERLLGRPRRR